MIVKTGITGRLLHTCLTHLAVMEHTTKPIQIKKTSSAIFTEVVGALSLKIIICVIISIFFPINIKCFLPAHPTMRATMFKCQHTSIA